MAGKKISNVRGLGTPGQVRMLASLGRSVFVYELQGARFNKQGSGDCERARGADGAMSVMES